MEWIQKRDGQTCFIFIKSTTEHHKNIIEISSDVLNAEHRSFHVSTTTTYGMLAICISSPLHTNLHDYIWTRSHKYITLGHIRFHSPFPAVSFPHYLAHSVLYLHKKHSARLIVCSPTLAAAAQVNCSRPPHRVTDHKMRSACTLGSNIRIWTRAQWMRFCRYISTY